jgi:hypothetical protein
MDVDAQINVDAEEEENNDDHGHAALSDSPMLQGLLLGGEAAAVFHTELLDALLSPTDCAMLTLSLLLDCLLGPEPTGWNGAKRFATKRRAGAVWTC